ncbi:hypothetical protein [Parabacteroides johnsonii]|uniref:hypothetical protein n=1 Tax=Parabacteroides johnsonii TaxID=387661 RepID=UPI00242AECC5|nr:hypothetical protein [Parabacteroides johnsonii]
MEVRKELTDEKQRRGVEGQQFATLTDINYHPGMGRPLDKSLQAVQRVEIGKLVRQYDEYRISVEYAGQTSVTEIFKQRKEFQRNIKVAQSGGSVAKVARTPFKSS